MTGPPARVPAPVPVPAPAPAGPAPTPAQVAGAQLAPSPAHPVRPVPLGVPGRIRVITAATVTALGVLLAALAVGGGTAGDGLRVIGRDAGPQVVATAGLYFGLSDMDAQVADALLMGKEYGERRRAALTRYDQRRAEANAALLKAFELSGDNAAERRTVQSVLDGLGRYERLAGQALLLDARSGHPAGSPPEDVVGLYRQATDLMRQVLLPQAYNLTLESGTIVRATHDDKSASVPTLRAVVVVTGLVALACLVWLQFSLARRFRRLLAPALLAATAVTIAAVFGGVSVLGRNQLDLRTAKAEGFDPVLTVARARAISNSMQGDQSRYLLDKDRADTYEHTFLDKSQTVFYLPAGNLGAYHARVAGGATDYLGLMGVQVAGAEGQRVVAAYRKFQEADTALRAMVRDGRTGDAVAARLGPVREAFDAYDRTLLALSQRHQAAFERAIGSGERALDTLWRLLPFAIGGLGLLVVAGVWPRLKEYR
ncbi:hypothetical protein ACWGH8_35520 [Nonomuraea muscovyensis]|uniref:Uncharacterized protein n=1 Tax=Nonomuraea muscovyensis TaxID=1124761 RepID=A0A7X0BWX4_9ACTN|nr:hypothetical protein [Nonomuraea muscovyensis]MBB6344454.1 hypothetical protein [Nonomuraea muscovyensis]